MLNAEQILEKGLLKLEHSKGKPAQIGYDLSVKEIKKLSTYVGSYGNDFSTVGNVFKDSTKLANSYIENCNKSVPDQNKEWKLGWELTAGYYEVTFWEGCKIPNNYVGLIRQRSSMLRNGTILHSSVFDPGFETEFMGSFIAVFCPIFIEKDARIAQIYFHECEPVSSANLYGGKDSQYQFDNQRNR